MTAKPCTTQIKVGATNGDALHFYIDGVQKGQWSGEVDWKAVSYPLTAGPHTLRWSYEKDSAKTAGKDQAWIDDQIF